MPTKAPKAQSSKAGSKGTGGKKPNALQKPLQPSKELAAVVGAEPLPRGEVVSKVWDYIKQHGLQNPENRREIQEGLGLGHLATTAYEHAYAAVQFARILRMRWG